MIPPRKLVIYLIAGISAFAVLAAVFGDSLIQIGGAILLFFAVFNALVEGEVYARKMYRRSDSPALYWCIVAFYCAALVITAFRVLNEK